MDQIWLASPSPAMRLWPASQPVAWRLNPAALAWARGLRLTESAWRAIADELAQAHATNAAREGRLTAIGMRWRSVPMSIGWLVWLMPDRSASEGRGAWGSLVDKLDLVQEFGRIGLFERDLRTGEGRWDSHMFRLFGVDPARGMPSWPEAVESIHPEDRERFRSEHERFFEEPGRHVVRYRVALSDGTLRDMQTFAEVRLGADGRPALMIGVVVDDTEGAGRIRAQEAISDQHAKALRLAEIAVWRVDLEKRRIHFNDVGYSLLGQPPAAGGVSLARMRAMLAPEDVPAMERAMEDALRSNAVVDMEARYPMRTGAGHRHMLTRRVTERDDEGRPIGVLGIALDQTLRFAERERAQALARRIELVAETAGVGIWSSDLETGEVEWNRQMFLIQGLPVDAPPPTFHAFASEMVHPDDREAFRSAARQALRAGDPRFDTEFRIQRPDGSVRWVEFRARRDQRDGRSFLLGIELDATSQVEQRAAAEQIRREKEAAEQASAAKSAFLARMSHELRTPLNAVLGFAQLVEHEGAAVPMAVQLARVAHIRQAGEQLLELISDVLDQVTLDALSSGSSAGMDLLPETPVAVDVFGEPMNGSITKVANEDALSVLYIEDNPVNVILVEQLVAMRANTVLHCAPDGLSGVAVAEARAPHVVLVDMQLPDIDGFEVLRRLRRLPALGSSAIIALSANGLSEDIALAREAGFDDYWTKPIDFRRFLHGLDSLAAAR